MRNVLILTSPGHDPFKYHTEIFRAELTRRSAVPINFYEVSSQPPVALTATGEGDPVLDYLTATLAGHTLDLIVAVGGPAIVFAHQNHERLFPATPLIYASVDSRFLSGRTLAANETAIAGRVDMSKVVANMLVLLPDTRNVFVVIGTSPLEQFWRGELGRELERFRDRLTFQWADDLSFAETKDRAATLPPHSAILFPILSIDGNGVLQSQDLALTELHAVANAPIFGIYDFQVGRGIVGGPLLSMSGNARNTADAAVRILNGEPAGQIHVPLEEHGRPTYDWRELRRWGIDETRLAAGSVVQFRPPSVWDEYKGYIVGGISVVALQSMLIGGLLVQRSRRRRTERALRESERHSRESEAALRQSYEQNQHLAGRLISAQDAERARIARDLHDDVSQQLAGLSIAFSGLQHDLRELPLGENIEQDLRTFQQRTTAVVQNVRHLSHDLHPTVLRHAGLVASLSSHCADLQRIHRTVVTCSAEGDFEAISAEASLCLYRIAQEALRNVMAHAAATRTDVHLLCADAHAEMTVADNGKGFIVDDAAGRGKGLGLVSIIERAKLAGGTVSVASEVTKGTRVSARIPFARAAASGY